MMPEIPKTCAECADQLYLIRQERLQLQKDVDALAEYESALKKSLIDALPRGEASGIMGKVAKVHIFSKDEPTAEDWHSTWKYIKANDAWELLQKRLNAAAVKERWEQGEEIPGVGRFTKIDVSCTKI